MTFKDLVEKNRLAILEDQKSMSDIEKRVEERLIKNQNKYPSSTRRTAYSVGFKFNK